MFPVAPRLQRFRSRSSGAGAQGLSLLAALLLVVPGVGLAPDTRAAIPQSLQGLTNELPEDLRTRQARYHLLVGDPLTAIASNPHPQTREHRLLHAQALADLGLYQAARDELEALAATGSEISAHAGLELVRLAMRTGDLPGARQWLDKVLPRLQGDARQEALYREAELKRMADNLTGAAASLQQMGNNTWTGLGYFNLAAAYNEADSSPSRPLVALRVASSTAARDDSAAARDLVDRSNLAAAILAMEHEDYRKASSFLERVRLDSYEAPRALYLHGLAQLKQENVRGALQSWHRASKFPLAFAGSAEAYIAMGQGYDEAGSSSQAADAFLAAHSVFGKAQSLIEDLASQVEEQGGYQALVKVGRQQDLAWYLQDSQTITAPPLAWLLRFLESAEAQHSVQRLAELDRMDRRLEQKQAELGVLRASLDQRLEAASRLTAEAGGVQAKRKQVLARIEALQQRVTALRDRQGSGALGGDLLRVERQLGRAEQALDGLVDRIGKAPARYRQLLAKLEVAGDELDRQRARIRELHQRSDKLLTEQVLAFLDRRKTDLQHFANRSEQEIARLYEYMAVSRLRSGRDVEDQP